jgi:6-phosphogluconolactonase/glucosamine-6-phosphate isomerase/deaminase
MPYDADLTPDQHAAVYNERVPRVDIGLFGIGPDGHIGSLFPGHELLSSDATGYIGISDSPKLPVERITVSPQMVSEISYTFLAIMQGKEDIFAEFTGPEVSVEECPAKMLQSNRHLMVMSNI